MAVPKPNPKRLALQVIAGASLCSLSYFIVLLLDASAASVRIGAFSAMMLAGALVWIVANRRFKQSYRAGVWSEEELAPTWALLAHPLLIAATAALVVVGLCLSLVTKHGSLIYLTVLPLSALSDLRAALSPSRQRASLLGDRQTLMPLHSDHWGKAPQSHDEPHPSWTPRSMKP